MYTIVYKENHIVYNELLMFKSARKAKQYMRMKRLDKNKLEIIFKYK